MLRLAAVSVVALAALVVTSAVGVGQSAPPSATPTFNKDVAPILYRNCTGCHRPGEIAPMSLLSYEQARPWARAIFTQTERGTMPPWHADPTHGTFQNDRRLTESEKDTIARWANGGAPEGDPGDRPTPPVYTQGWTIGEPDAVFSLPEDYPVAARGTIAYQYFEIPTNFTEDRWIQAIDVRPGNPAVVHHVILYARPPRPAARPAADAPRPAPTFSTPDGQNEIPAGQTGGPSLPADKQPARGPNDRPAPSRMGNMIGGFAPGQLARVYADGTGIRVPAGADLVVQMHYTANGKATTDRTRIGFRFAKERPATELRLTALVNGTLHIPAGASNHQVDAEMTMERDVVLWSLLPHTHLRGKRWVYEARYPDGRQQTLLSVPRYDFNWQTDYIFTEPVTLPKGTVLHATAWYDNSTGNRYNPDPTAEVWWGDQTWEEMMFTGFVYSVK